MLHSYLTIVFKIPRKRIIHMKLFVLYEYKFLDVLPGNELLFGAAGNALTMLDNA